MHLVEILFWISFAFIIYTYIGYGAILGVMVLLKKLFRKSDHRIYEYQELPEVTLVIAAYNEEEFIREKILNSLNIKYPEGKFKIVIVTDGSNDNTPAIVKEYPSIICLHKAQRRGKMAAVHRAMEHVTSPVVIFSDANTLLNDEVAIKLVRHFKDEKIGAVAGEKRVSAKESANATAGEGIYWKYESTLKRWDSKLYSTIGAAGELFSIRRKLYFRIPSDTIIEDFYITLKIAEKGYIIQYEPDAYAIESPSASIGEELKRKIRIAAGGLQAIYRLQPLFNPFKYGLLSFQFVSHRVLRWTLAPLALLVLLATNIWLVIYQNSFLIHDAMLYVQLFCYALALLGGFLASRKIKFKALFVPYYFLMMNYAVYVGFYRFVTNSQSAIWEKAKRGH